VNETGRKGLGHGQPFILVEAGIRGMDYHAAANPRFRQYLLSAIGFVFCGSFASSQNRAIGSGGNLRK